MNLDKLRTFCLSLTGTSEDFPFDKTTLAFRVNGKIYALTDIEEFHSINLKCNPERAIELRASYPENILPGYHMNKKHWNTVVFKNFSNDKLLFELIEHSYSLVIKNKK